MLDTVRLGVIGVGGMGGHHAWTVFKGKIPHRVLGAICDVSERGRAKFPATPACNEAEAMFGSGQVDAHEYAALLSELTAASSRKINLP